LRIRRLATWHGIFLDFESASEYEPVIFPSEHDFALLLFQLFALLSLALALGELF
jgi:hypothetical protein